VVLKLAGAAMDSKSRVKSAASRFFFVTNFFASNFSVMSFSVTKLFVTFFFVAKVFFVADTIVPIPIPCVPSFLWKLACFFN
jgi:hypothetical protein